MLDMKSYWVLLSIMLACSEAAKILVVFPFPIRSHANLGEGVVRHLLKAGHEVTYVTAYAYENPHANLRIVDVEQHHDGVNIKSIMQKRTNVENRGFWVYGLAKIIKNATEHPSFKQILVDAKEQFDVVIADWLSNELPAGYAAIFNCPLIWVSSKEPHWLILNLIDQPLNPAYNPDPTSPYSPPLNFLQRARELWIQIKFQFMQYVALDAVQITTYEELIAPIILKRGRQPPSFVEIRYNASLVLGNSYVSMGEAVTVPQNYKSIGGFHIEENVKPLPGNLKKIMDNSKHGVIYFSMGSILKSKDLPDEIKRSLLKMFGNLKQTVLWKFEEVLPDLPPNVHTLTWAPQTGILAHSNCVVFITHGGLLSTTEAIHFGVPIIGIPVYTDQFPNVLKAVKKGIAKRVDLSYTMADKLKEAIIEVTTNPRYAEKAKELSFIHHDRPTKPGTELVHWVQHVVRTRGAPHLRSPAFYMPFYQKLYLDLAAVIAAILVALLLFLKRVCAIVCPKKKIANQKKSN